MTTRSASSFYVVFQYCTEGRHRNVHCTQGLWQQLERMRSLVAHRRYVHHIPYLITRLYFYVKSALIYDQAAFDLIATETVLSSSNEIASLVLRLAELVWPLSCSFTYD